MKRKALFIICAVLILLLSGCELQSEIKPNDVIISMKVISFLSPCEYRTYFNLFNTTQTDDDYIGLSKETKQVIISWELNSNIRAKDPDRLYYGPYIIIVPPNGEWEYADTNNIIWKSYVRSLPGIITSILKDYYPEHNWDNIETFGWYFHAKSFDQGNIDTAFKKRVKDSYGKQIEIYFVYFDPVTKYGWAKKIMGTID